MSTRDSVHSFTGMLGFHSTRFGLKSELARINAACQSFPVFQHTTHNILEVHVFHALLGPSDAWRRSINFEQYNMVDDIN